MTPPGDADSLAAGARRLYDAGPEARANMGRRGLTYYRQYFDRVAVIDRVEALMHRFATTQTNGDRR